MQDSAVQFYSKLFSSECEGRRPPILPFQFSQLGQADNDLLQALPTLEEVRSVVFSLSAESAPGPDGLALDFTRAIGE